MPSDVATRASGRSEMPLLRFDRVERTLHWVNATLFGILMLTGAALYAGPISTLVGNRETVRFLHVYSGLILPIPLLVAVLGHHGARLRSDLGRLNRWSRDDMSPRLMSMSSVSRTLTDIGGAASSTEPP